MGLVTFVMVSWDLGDRKIWDFSDGETNSSWNCSWDMMGYNGMYKHGILYCMYIYIYILSIYYMLYNGMI